MLSFDIFLISKLYSSYRIMHFNSVIFIRKLDKFLFFSTNIGGINFLNSYLKCFVKFEVTNLVIKGNSVNSLYSGFHFLNWFFFKTFITKIHSSVSFFAFRNYKVKIKIFVKQSYNSFYLVRKLNKHVSWWVKEFKNVSSFNTLSLSLDVYLYKLLWKWCKRFHPRRSNSWIFNKYWKNISGRYKFFSANPLTGDILFLISHNVTSLSSTILLPSCTSSFEFFDKSKFHYDLFKKTKMDFQGIYGILFDNQRGICPCCNKPFFYFSLHDLRILHVSSSFDNQKSTSRVLLVHNYCFSFIV